MNTIFPLVGYMIKRYFYPSCYFNDQSFFIFSQNSADSIQNTIQSAFSKLLQSNEDVNKLFQKEIYGKIKLENHSKREIFVFKENDFITLRNDFIYLVIHIKILYLFALKKNLKWKRMLVQS